MYPCTEQPAQQTGEMKMSDILYKAEIVPVSKIKHGDTVEVDGRLETVSLSHLKHGFCGHTYKGAAYPKGIKRALIARAKVGGGFIWQ